MTRSEHDVRCLRSALRDQLTDWEIERLEVVPVRGVFRGGWDGRTEQTANEKR